MMNPPGTVVLGCLQASLQCCVGTNSLSLQLQIFVPLQRATLPVTGKRPNLTGLDLAAVALVEASADVESVVIWVRCEVPKCVNKAALLTKPFWVLFSKQRVKPALYCGWFLDPFAPVRSQLCAKTVAVTQGQAVYIRQICWLTWAGVVGTHRAWAGVGIQPVTCRVAKEALVVKTAGHLDAIFLGAMFDLTAAQILRNALRPPASPAALRTGTGRF